jgi:exoribonuclease R
MNYETSKRLLKHKIGIYRQLDHKNKSNDYKDLPDCLTDDKKMLIFFFKSQSAKYCEYQDSIYESIIHNNIKQYTHITSPIRRLVDLLNSIVLQEKLGLVTFSSDAHKFYEGWFSQLDYINLTMRSIRKVQNRCDILKQVTEIKKTQDLNNIKYSGVPFDEVIFENGMYQYTVLVSELKYFVKYVTPIRIKEYNEYNFNVFIFEDEDTLKKKIRIKLHDIDAYKVSN